MTADWFVPTSCLCSVLSAHREKVRTWNTMQKFHQSYWMAKPTGACLKMAVDFIVVWNHFKSTTIFPFAKRMCEHFVVVQHSIWRWNALYSFFNCCESGDLSICSSLTPQIIRKYCRKRLKERKLACAIHFIATIIKQINCVCKKKVQWPAFLCFYLSFSHCMTYLKDLTINFFSSFLASACVNAFSIGWLRE